MKRRAIEVATSKYYRLTKLQTVQRDEFNTQREYERELRTVCSNVDLILETHSHVFHKESTLEY